MNTIKDMKRYKEFEPLNPGQINSLLLYGNTIISVEHFNQKLCDIYNFEHTNKIKPHELAQRGDNLYNELLEDYREMIFKRIEHEVEFGNLPSSGAGDVDCIKIVCTSWW